MVSEVPGPISLEPITRYEGEEAVHLLAARKPRE
jgi:hypothetical protein